MKSSNPVLGRLTATAHQSTYQAPDGPGYGQPYSYGGQTHYPESPAQASRDGMPHHLVVHRPGRSVT